MLNKIFLKIFDFLFKKFKKEKPNKSISENNHLEYDNWKPIKDLV